MASTADLVGTIMQHVYEPLYTFDANWASQPMLAAGMPKVSADGKIYTIELRKGVKLHNGRDLDAEDVVASLQALDGDDAARQGARQRASRRMTAKGPDTVEIALNDRQPPLLAHLALPSGLPAIMAKESIAKPLVEFVGTGPYKFRERKPDQFVRADAASTATRARNEAGQRLCGQARGQDRGAALHAGAERQHPRRRRRWPASTSSPTCCRSRPTRSCRGPRGARRC